MPNPSDTRSPLERAADLTDGFLLDFYHANSLFDADANDTFTRDEIFNLARNAFIEGVAAKTRDPSGLADFARTLNAVVAEARSTSDV